MVLVAAIPLSVYCATDGKPFDSAQFPPQFLQFCAAKEQQARKLADQLDLKVSPQIWDYFKSAKQGDWTAVSNAYVRLKRRANQYEGSKDDPTVGTPVWQTIIEVQTAYEAFALGELKYTLAYGEGIIRSIPPGSIYFGGTDPGRGLVTALCKSHERGDPFYTITQNALADSRYIDYLRAMYGRRIYLPTTNDVQNAFQDYMEDVQQRMKHDRRFSNEPRQVKAGENVHMSEDGRLQVSGQTAVMMINALIAKVIFDHNTNCEYYVEESFPLDWMYPYLSPHELIFKLNRSPLPSLTAEVLDQDHAFWTQKCQSMLGDWLKPGTSVTDVCAFARTVYVNKDLSHFRGDQRYVGNEYACKSFSKLRSSIAGVYNWRLDNKTDGSDKARLLAETDYAYRQAFALCPYSPEAVFRYANFLSAQNRLPEAILIVRTARELDPKNEPLNDLLNQLLDQRNSKGGADAPHQENG